MSKTHHDAEPPHIKGKEPCGKTWLYCECMYSESDMELRASAGTMSASGRRAPAPRAQKDDHANLALAIWNEDEVGSEPETREALTGAAQPQEGSEMATATKKATKKATSKKTTTKAAAPKPESNGEAKVDKRTDAEARRGRGGLEALVVEVTDAFENGKVELPEGKTLTPQRIANIIGEKPGEDKPSGGAVTNIIRNWDEAGYALTHEKPFAFKAVSARGKKQGLDALKEKLREKKKAERAAEREAAKKS